MATPITHHTQSPIGGFPPAPTPTLPLATVRSWTHTNTDFNQGQKQQLINQLMQQLFNERIVQNLCNHTTRNFEFSLFVKEDGFATMTVRNGTNTYDLLGENNTEETETQDVMRLIHQIIGTSESEESPTEEMLRSTRPRTADTQTTTMAELEERLAQSEAKNQSLEEKLTTSRTLVKSCTEKIKKFRTAADSKIGKLEGELERATKKLAARHQDASSPYAQALEELRTSLEQAQTEKQALEQRLEALNNQSFGANNGTIDPPPAFDEKSADLEQDQSSEMIQNAQIAALEKKLAAAQAQIIHLRGSRAFLLENINPHENRTPLTDFIDLDLTIQTIAKRGYRISELEEQVDEDQQKIAELERENSETIDQLNNLADKLDNSIPRNQHEKELAKVEKKLKAAQLAVASVRAAQSLEVSNEMVHYSTELEKAKKARNKVEAELEEASREFEERNTAQLKIINDLKENLASQIAMNEAREGAVRTIASEKRELEARIEKLEKKLKTLVAYENPMERDGYVAL